MHRLHARVDGESKSIVVEPITESAILGGGCFWCLDAAFREISGIENVICGYAGGQWPDPSYERVSAGTTGHAEVVEIFFDPEIISYTDVLDIFWVIHDPTTKNAQGHDIGSQYRSIILYQSEDQKNIAAQSIAEIAKLWPNPVVTELLPLEKFYPAEDYHQEYFAKNPGQGYCVAVINPKLVKIREKFKARLKP
jgi:peptide-methionine (S)-S-oxide reductase